MQKEKASHEKELETLKAQAFNLLESEKASYQQELEALKATLSRDNDRATQTFREKLDLYKEALDPVLELIMRMQMDRATVTYETMKDFETKRLTTTAMLGMFATPAAFEAYNTAIDYLFDSVEEKRPFNFEEFRLLGFAFLVAARKDIGLAGEELVYRGTR